MDEANHDNKVISQTDNYSLNYFEFYDCWLLFSIGFSKWGNTIKWILRSGDSYNHSVFSLEELNYGMSKLIGNGYVVKEVSCSIASY